MRRGSRNGSTHGPQTSDGGNSRFGPGRCTRATVGVFDVVVVGMARCFDVGKVEGVVGVVGVVRF
jgi:hypothetical protein